MISLDKKTILITGGAGGLGEDMALLFSKLGARIVVADLAADRAEDLARRIGGNAVGLGVDIADEESVRSMVAAALAQFGQIDVLVNNAAMTDHEGDLDVVGTDLATWDRTMDVNVRGTLLVSRAVIPHMLEREDGAVIAIVSRQGIAPPSSATRLSYSVSKAAMIMMSRHMAVAYGKRGIRSNAVAPGAIMSRKARAVLSEERIAQSGRNVLTPELGQPSDVSGVVAFLASDAARYITGQTLQVDGGVLSYLHE